MLSRRGLFGLFAGAAVAPLAAKFGNGVEPPAATVNPALQPDADFLVLGGGPTQKAWTDLFLTSGAVIDFAPGDVTITHGAERHLAHYPRIGVIPSLPNTGSQSGEPSMEAINWKYVVWGAVALVLAAGVYYYVI